MFNRFVMTVSFYFTFNICEFLKFFFNANKFNNFDEKIINKNLTLGIFHKRRIRSILIYLFIN